ncbi:GGDEF domain-containing protein [Marinobacter orientalis]|uniref:diguanylate cyclase n=1 Tax=Marinobacter orientalis TaxID=1928859 RepID=A0A7Y0NL41_9GAMM|nr:GGDEF domain-containing protein [Marinobacter orientalis]NMT63004.1 GGDEF domain-containing protein [Marinobacter orientalis]TGX51669.1 GGDEF domain-containing protein [Marinobacter orientalis]
MDSYKDSLKELARPYRKAVLKALLLVTLVGATLFSSMNFLKGSYPLALVEIAMGIYAIVVYRAIRHTRHLERWIIAYLIPFFTAMMFAMATPRSTSAVHAWVLLIPIVSHLLLGRRLGLAVSAIYMGIAAVIFLFRHQDQPEMMQALPITNIAMISLCILVFSHVYEVTRETSERKLMKTAQTDPLTGLANRARLSDIFEREKHRAQRYSLPISILVLDLDHFKNVNDDHGHESGDRALQHVARIFRECLRATDLPARLGGEEFGILLSNTNSQQAMEVAEKIRIAVASTPLTISNNVIRLTLSGGVAELGSDGHTLRDLVREADIRLYTAKNTGRNQIIPALSPSATAAQT